MTNQEHNPSNAAIIEKAGKRAYELLDEYHGCAQCILVALQETFGLEDDILAKASVLLSGGVGGTRVSACGLISGACLALGIKYGRDVSMLKGPADKAIAQELAGLDPAGKLCKWFEREFGTMNCNELRFSHLGTELNSKVPWQKQMEDDLGIRAYCCELAIETAKRAAALMINPNMGILELDQL
jgi:hypothetical protein